MIKEFNIQSVGDVEISGKRVIVRVDFDVPFANGNIADDRRITANIPTLKRLLEQDNKLILIAKRGRPEGRDPQLSLQPILDQLPQYLPDYSFSLIKDVMKEPSDTFTKQKQNEIIVLENIRFYSKSIRESAPFIQKLASLGDVYVGDAFSMAHRKEPTITELPKHMEKYAGLLLEKEVNMIMHVLKTAKKPVVSIIGGAKIKTKVEPIKKLIEISDHILLGGGVANTFLKAHGYDIGGSLYEESEVQKAADLIDYASDLPVTVMLPVDARVGNLDDHNAPAHVVSLPTLPQNGHILDIGPRTGDIFYEVISDAQTIIWNGPMGVFERDEFRLGTDDIYKAIVHNDTAFSLVGGGDTAAALSKKKQQSAINHISTGGGAMYHLIEHENLPGLQALE